MRLRHWVPLAVKNYQLVHAFFHGTVEEVDEPEFCFDPHPELLEAYLNVSEGEIIDFDTETTGLNNRQDVILGWSFSTQDDTAMAVYLKQPIEEDPRYPVIKACLEDTKRRKCWQNGCFDTGFARSNNIIDENFYFDTRLAQQLLNSDLPSDLDFLRAEYTDIKPYKPSKADMKKMQTWPKERMLEYACWDAHTLREVRKKQVQHLSEGQVQVMQELLIPLSRAINAMEATGVLVDVETLAAIYSQIAPQLEEMALPFHKLGLNPRSPVQMKPFFHKDHDGRMLTGGQKIKDTQELTLERQIKRAHPKAELMRLLLDYRKLQKLESTYLRGVFKRLENGRIHTHFKIEGTGTGRLSSENPNLQNVPHHMRVIYIADPGYVLVKGDYSQIELWVVAITIYNITGCDAMLKDLQAGEDIHYHACQLCWGTERELTGNRKDDYTEREQLIAKAMVFGTVYDRTAHSIALEFAVTRREAELWQMQLVNKYPGMARYKDHCETAFNRTGYLDTPFGRRRYLQTFRQGLNFPIQSTASDITLWAIVLLHQAGLDLLLSVHDDILIRSKEGEVEEDLKTFKRVMERTIPELNNMNFKAGFSTGENWTEMKEVEVIE